MKSRCKLVLRHQNSKALHSVPKEAEKYLTEAGTTDDMTNDHGKTATWKVKQLKLKYKEDFKKMVRDKWKEKAMCGKFPNYLDKDHVDVELSFELLKAHWTQEKLKDSSQQHRIRHWTPDTTSSTSSSKDPMTDAECTIASQKLWNASYQGAKH